jgi:hypothetical protein
MHLDYQVTRKSGYITNRMYTLGTRDKHDTWSGCSSLWFTNQTMYQGELTLCVNAKHNN